jgi:predicted CXXCH cytochrome family protein
MFEARNLKAIGVLLTGVLVIWIALILSVFHIDIALAEEPNQETEAYCLSCHANPDLSMTLPNGEKLSLYIAPEVLSHSIHSSTGIECEACHTEIKTYPHPKIEFETRRELSRSYYQACQKCHPSNYEQTMDSIHASVAQSGNLDAPICTDCHGAHDVQPAGEPRSQISTTCGECHAQILSEYKDSIHGSALLQEDNTDVPVCTDCHGVHNIQDPRTAQFRVESPDLCASCHSNQELMAKYGIQADVYGLYEVSWHGVDLSMYRAQWPTLWHNSAVCSDCHGVHNIRKTDDPASTVHPDNLLATCQECHPGAGPNWTAAWVGHNRIDPDKTPILYLTEQFYSSFIPAVLWLSVIYVLLQIFHAIVDRIRRSLS